MRVLLYKYKSLLYKEKVSLYKNRDLSRKFTIRRII